MRKSGMWFPRLLLAAAVLLLAASLCSANERIVFNSGHTIVATSSRVEGDFIFLTLADGSEVGFPKSLVRETKKGAQIRHYAPAHGWSGRGPSATETEAYRRHMVAMGKAGALVEGVAARRSPGERLNTAGFTVAGGFKNGPPRATRPGFDITDPVVRSTGGGGSNSQAVGTPRPRTRGAKSNTPVPSTQGRRQIQPRVDTDDPKGRNARR